MRKRRAIIVAVGCFAIWIWRPDCDPVDPVSETQNVVSHSELADDKDVHDDAPDAMLVAATQYDPWADPPPIDPRAPRLEDPGAEWSPIDDSVAADDSTIADDPTIAELVRSTPRDSAPALRRCHLELGASSPMEIEVSATTLTDGRVMPYVRARDGARLEKAELACLNEVIEGVDLPPGIAFARMERVQLSPGTEPPLLEPAAQFGHVRRLSPSISLSISAR